MPIQVLCPFSKLDCLFRLNCKNSIYILVSDMICKGVLPFCSFFFHFPGNIDAQKFLILKFYLSVFVVAHAFCIISNDSLPSPRSRSYPLVLNKISMVLNAFA
jgi:hypothetical protein